MLREASLLNSKDIDHNLCRSPTAAEAPMNHDVFALRDGQDTFVAPADGAHECEETVQSRSDPGTVLHVVRRPVAFRGLKVPPVEERVKRLESQRLRASCSTSRVIYPPLRLPLKATADPLRHDRLELGRALFPDAVARLQNV